MNEQNPELLKIMGTPPKGLIISGCFWFFLCISIITGMYFIKYSIPVNLSVVYIGNHNSQHENQLLFTLVENSPDFSLGKNRKIQIQFDNIESIKGAITEILIIDENKTLVIEPSGIVKQELPIGIEGKAKIAISEKRMIELIPFFRN